MTIFARIIRRIFKSRFKKLPGKFFLLLQKIGFNLTLNHYYQPIPDLTALKNDLWQKNSELPGIVLNDAKMLELLRQFREKFQSEYEKIPHEDPHIPGKFYLLNRDFGRVDAEILYCMIRRFQPRKIIEIGSGYSTLLTAQAVLENSARDKIDCNFTAIEPYPREMLIQGLPGLSGFIKSPVQEAPLSVFQELKENDILFIDSSHVLKTGSDVQYEFLEILPRLNKGVLIHIHDIFFPEEYPKSWLFEQLRFWNEQYLLQAFLAYNSAFEIVWAGNYMCLKYPDGLKQTFSSYDQDVVRSGSFWLRKIR